MRSLATTTIALGSLLFACSWPLTAMAVELAENVEMQGFGHVGFLEFESGEHRYNGLVGGRIAYQTPAVGL